MGRELRKRAASTGDATIEFGEVVEGGERIPYRIVRSARRTRTIEIRMDAGSVRIAAPMRTPASDIEELIRARSEWIARQLHAAPLVQREIEDRGCLPYWGRDVPLEFDEGEVGGLRVLFADWRFRVTSPPRLEAEQRRKLLRKGLLLWYRQRAEAHLPPVVAKWSAASGYVPQRVLVREQKSRWGSCSNDGTLRLNWRLVMAAPELTEYVVVHELVHLRHKNHGPQFWAEVRRLMPDAGERLKRLNAFGRTVPF